MHNVALSKHNDDEWTKVNQQQILFVKIIKYSNHEWTKMNKQQNSVQKNILQHFQNTTKKISSLIVYNMHHHHHLFVYNIHHLLIHMILVEMSSY